MFDKIKWGIHPSTNKIKTSNKKIELCNIPQIVIIPVRQHIGVPCIPIVKKGELVKKGQLIASSDELISSNIHSSISGMVKDIANRPHPVYGECLSIIIENDGLDKWQDGLLVERNWETMGINEILEIIKNAGIVGMGGAAFPSNIKLVPPKKKKIDTIVINAAECEPFLTVDHRIMLEYPKEAVIGMKIISKVLGVKHIIVGVEDNKKDAVKVIRNVLTGNEICVMPIPTIYPQGAEKMIIKTITGRDVPAGKLPMDAGIVVQNISTAFAIYEAVVKGIPLIERVVTVSGGAIKIPKNLKIRIGTTFNEVINFCGGFSKVPEKIIMGGPMMGITQFTTGVPVIKGTSGIIALDKKNVNEGIQSPCIRCGKCVSSCPMGLNPGILSILGEKENIDEASDEYHLFDCLECGCCSFVCPAKRNIVHYIKQLKKLSVKT